jgi:hypothetical protein
MVCPITSPTDPISGLASVKAWIPEGLWTDLFTGKTYTGQRITTLNRDLETYPVLAKAGAIIPTAQYPQGSNSIENPEELEILVFPGASGSYTLFEDDGITGNWESGNAYYTQFNLDWENRKFTVQGYGDASQVPTQRTLRITFRGFEDFIPTGAQISQVVTDPKTRSVTAILAPTHPDESIVLDLTGAIQEQNSRKTELAWEFLNLCRIELKQKVSIYKLIEEELPTLRILEELITLRTPLSVIDGLMEILIH